MGLLRSWLVMTCVALCLTGCVALGSGPPPTQQPATAKSSPETQPPTAGPAGLVGSPGSGQVPAATQNVAAAQQPTQSPVPSISGARASLAVEQTAAYQLLPEITVGVDATLVASVSYPASFVPSGALRAGDRVRLLGTDQDGAWLLVLRSGTLGWIPAIYSRTPIGTLAPTVVSYGLLDPCTGYLGAVQAPSGVWSSPVRGTAVVQGLVFDSQTAGSKRGVAIEIENAGSAVPVSLVPTALSGSGQVLFFTAEFANLQRDSRVRFRLSGFGNDSLAFQASFFTRECAQDGGTARLSGAGTAQPPAITSGPAPTPVVIVVESGLVTLSPPPSATSTRRSSPTFTLSPSRTSTPFPTPSHAQREATVAGRLLLRQGNGELIFAYLMDHAPQIDGSLNEWSARFYSIGNLVYAPTPEKCSIGRDLSGAFYIGWDMQNLYIGVDVTDDMYVQNDTGRTLYRGDDVEMQLDADLPGDFNDASVNDDDSQVGFSAGNLIGTSPEGYIWKPKERAGSMMKVAARPTRQGYTLEAAIPWWVFGVQPRLEQAYGFALSLSDDDTPGTKVQECMASTSPNRVGITDPTEWGNLILMGGP